MDEYCNTECYTVIQLCLDIVYAFFYILIILHFNCLICVLFEVLKKKKVVLSKLFLAAVILISL